MGRRWMSPAGATARAGEVYLATIKPSIQGPDDWKYELMDGADGLPPR